MEFETVILLREYSRLKSSTVGSWAPTGNAPLPMRCRRAAAQRRYFFCAGPERLPCSMARLSIAGRPYNLGCNATRNLPHTLRQVKDFLIAILGGARAEAFRQAEGFGSEAQARRGGER